MATLILFCDTHRRGHARKVNGRPARPLRLSIDHRHRKPANSAIVRRSSDSEMRQRRTLEPEWVPEPPQEAEAASRLLEVRRTRMRCSRACRACRVDGRFCSWRDTAWPLHRAGDLAGFDQFPNSSFHRSSMHRPSQSWHRRGHITCCDERCPRAASTNRRHSEPACAGSKRATHSARAARLPLRSRTLPAFTRRQVRKHLR